MQQGPSKGSLHAKNSEIGERSSSVHTQRPDRNNGGYRAASTTVRPRDRWAAADSGFEGRDARQPGCRQISPPLRGRWHQARKLPSPCPKVDRSSKRSTQSTAGVTKGFLFKATEDLFSGTRLREIQLTLIQIITRDAVKMIDDRVKEAVARGAKVHTGAKYDGQIYYPTILTNVPLDAAIANEETFGPVVVVEAGTRRKRRSPQIARCAAPRLRFSLGILTRHSRWRRKFWRESSM